MNEESTKALTAYDMLRADPAKAAKQDETFMTTRGLRQAGEIFADSARKAETALRELDEIIESIEESEL